MAQPLDANARLSSTNLLAEHITFESGPARHPQAWVQKHPKEAVSRPWSGKSVTWTKGGT